VGHYTQRLRAGEDTRTRFDEAGRLAEDLDHGLNSIEAALSTLRDRVKRLGETLVTAPSAAAPVVSQPDRTTTEIVENLVPKPAPAIVQNEEVIDAIPLISPPDEENPAAKTAVEEQIPDTKRRFSWQRE
jgi:hypothetical protein